MPTTLPSSASDWQLYTYEKGERPEGRVAVRSVVKALNDGVRAAAADPELRAAIKAAKKAGKDSYGDFDRTRLEKSPEWSVLRRAHYTAFRTHIAPALNKYAEYGAADSEPYHVASSTLSGMVLDALGVTDSFSRRWLRFDE
jgi:hypothetical protein